MNSYLRPCGLTSIVGRNTPGCELATNRTHTRYMEMSGRAQPGSASAMVSEGRQFESDAPPQSNNSLHRGVGFPSQGILNAFAHTPRYATRSSRMVFEAFLQMYASAL